jgi:hypothetical protein
LDVTAALDRMLPNSIHIDAIELLLASITLTMGDDGARASFLYGPPGARDWEKRIGTDIYYHLVDLELAALHVRSVGHRYLKALPLTEVCSKLQNFMSENFGYIGNFTFLSQDERPLNVWIPAKEKHQLARALASCALFQPEEELTVFPLVPVIVNKSFKSDQFFFTSPQDENSFFLEDEFLKGAIDTKKFPPNKSFEGKIRKPNSWLGVYSPDYRAALKTRSSILGALALTALPQYRHMFSGREMFGGRCSISSKRITFSFEKEHTPPCMNDIQITDMDFRWMSILSDKLRATDKATARELKALEYYFRAWPLSPEERFPVLCMALDAIFGDSNNATQSVIDGVNETLGGIASERQLRDILSLRGSVIHGGAPDVYDSSKYPKYYRKYSCDPIRDLELVVSACLKERVFQGELQEHPDPNGDLIEKARAAGQIPRKVDAVSILNPKV